MIAMIEADLVRQELMLASNTRVVKVGTSVLATPDGQLDYSRVTSLSNQIAGLVLSGIRIALVSSGAVGAGIARLGLDQRPTALRQLQAAAAAGQAQLMAAYERAFSAHGLHTAQVLVTREDFDDRTRYLNVRNTLNTLFEYGLVPILNENDTVSVDEIKFGDNDLLAALVADAIGASLAIFLTVVDGLYPVDPTSGSDPDGSNPLPIIHDLDEAISRFVSSGRSPLGSGGMKSKLEAAKIISRSGGAVIISSGKADDCLVAIQEGRPRGTLILPRGRLQHARRRWISSAARPQGTLIVDYGARRAIQDQSGSLLPIGVLEVLGEFQKGDVVAIQDPFGAEFARGLSNLSSQESSIICGLRTDQIVARYGPGLDEELVHRNNLVLLD